MLPGHRPASPPPRTCPQACVLPPPPRRDRTQGAPPAHSRPTGGVCPTALAGCHRGAAPPPPPPRTVPQAGGCRPSPPRPGLTRAPPPRAGPQLNECSPLPPASHRGPPPPLERTHKGCVSPPPPPRRSRQGAPPPQYRPTGGCVPAPPPRSRPIGRCVPAPPPLNSAYGCPSPHQELSLRGRHRAPRQRPHRRTSLGAACCIFAYFARHVSGARRARRGLHSTATVGRGADVYHFLTGPPSRTPNVVAIRATQFEKSARRVTSRS